jgi:hypothetical protein
MSGSHLDVAAEAVEIEQVERAITEDLIRDVGIANRHVLRLGIPLHADAP